MCGICGHYSPAGATPEVVDRMLDCLAHRGPDDEGRRVSGRIGLGNRRLSIIDLAGGAQPIANEDESCWIVYNGEIYNYVALRRELLARGHRFRTASDTEVILHLYEELGDACVTRLRGMFAFAIWDARHERLLLARDHLGQKPLFYAHDGHEFFFASELKAILAVWDKPRRLDVTALHHYLSLRFIPPPQTMIAGVSKLPPAHTLAFQDGRVSLNRYWSLSFHQKLEGPESELLDRLQAKLRETVALHLVSDVPVGAFLSGGMDSSMVVALMARDLGQDVATFAIGVEEQDFNELPHARMVAEHLGTRHHDACVAADIVDTLPQMIWHLDEPSDPIAACQYQAALLASRHVKVVLGGDGGDELFAGFDRYVGVGYVGLYAWLPRLVRRGLFGPLLARLPDSFGYKNLVQKLRWLHQLGDQPDLARRYAEATCFFRFSHRDKAGLFTPAAWDGLRAIDSRQIIVDPFNDAPAVAPLERMLYADYQTRLPEHSLMLTDRLSMAHGLELRSPFLDHELVSLLAAFPADMKIRHRELKYSLRRLGQAYLPAPILSRPKQGFMFPVAYWFRGPLFPFLRRVLHDSPLLNDGLIRRAAVDQLLEAHRQGRADHHVRLWMLLNLEVWRRLVLGGQDVPATTAWLRSHRQDAA